MSAPRRIGLRAKDPRLSSPHAIIARAGVIGAARNGVARLLQSRWPKPLLRTVPHVAPAVRMVLAGKTKKEKEENRAAARSAAGRVDDLRGRAPFGRPRTNRARGGGKGSFAQLIRLRPRPPNLALSLRRLEQRLFGARSKPASIRFPASWLKAGHPFRSSGHPKPKTVRHGGAPPGWLGCTPDREISVLKKPGKGSNRRKSFCLSIHQCVAEAQQNL